MKSTIVVRSANMNVRIFIVDDEPAVAKVLDSTQMEFAIKLLVEILKKESGWAGTPPGACA